MLTAATVVLASVGLAAGPVGAGPGGGWGAAWATAPSAAVRNVPAGYAGFTIRNVVHTTIGGGQVRIRLSNRFGTLPLPLGHVTVAISAHAGGRKDGTIDRSDGSARPGTIRDVRFGGALGTTVAAGAEIISDPVPLTVPADHDLLVSTWTPEPSGTVTFHPAAMQDSFFADDGVDRSAEPGAAGFPHTTRVWHYVSGVDVSGAPGTIVALGDSITDGVTSTWGANRRWTDYLAHRLAGQGQVPRYGVANTGISGNRILLDDGYPNADMFRSNGRSAQARFAADVLTQPGARTVILFEGINDIQQSPQQTDPAQIIAGLQQLTAQARAQGLRVIGATIMPWQGWGSYTPEREAVREAVNAWIRTGQGLDGIADFDAATRDPADPHRLLPAYDSGDHLHPNDAGDRAMAAAIPLHRL
jgi:lysophospholipase L1-like esterase